MGPGNDTLTFYGDFHGGEVFDGGKGVDLLQWTLASSKVAVTLSVAELKGSYHLDSGATLGGFERMQLSGSKFGDRLTGGRFDDVLRGEAGDDLLKGQGGRDELTGGAGNDTLIGGAGNDSLIDTEGANVMSGGGGKDRLVSYSTQAQDMAGGGGRDSLTGGSGADHLDGGAGGDVLTGGAGADVFEFTAKLKSAGYDRITDFTSGVDHFHLGAKAFAALHTGPLSAADFVLGTVAQDSSDRIVYDAAKGKLWYDADGNGAHAAVVFAVVPLHTVIVAGDFEIS